MEVQTKQPVNKSMPALLFTYGEGYLTVVSSTLSTFDMWQMAYLVNFYCKCNRTDEINWSNIHLM